MKNYYRLMLGKKSAFAQQCFEGNFIGTDFEIHEDLTENLPDEWRDFNKQFIPIFLTNRPDKSKIAAGLACGALWRVSKGIQQGDIVLCPDGSGNYRVGEVNSAYFYQNGQVLPHRRQVKWYDQDIPRSAMSESLKYSTGSIGTVSNVSYFCEEIESLRGNSKQKLPPVFAESGVEDPVVFALEKHLEAFLVSNWNQTILSKEFNIFEEDGELVGQQYATDAGTIDILAISKDKKRILVVELKRGRASDDVVGQLLRYIGYIKEQIAEENQIVEGVIIALEDDKKLRWALVSVPFISFYRYEVSFKLLKG